MKKLTRLEALEDIRHLKARYFQAVDGKDWQTIVDVFTPEARVDFGGEVEHHIGHHGVVAGESRAEDWVVIGGPATAKVIEGAVGNVICVHQGHDPQIEIISDDRATGRWTLYDRLEYPEEVMHGYGYYEEEYERTNGRWRISSLILKRTRVVWETKA